MLQGLCFQNTYHVLGVLRFILTKSADFYMCAENEKTAVGA